MKGIVVNSERMVTGTRPLFGRAMAVSAVAMPVPGGCTTAAIQALPSRLALRPNGRNDGGSNPGEGTA